MKKLMLALLMSCVVGTVSAADSDAKPKAISTTKEQALAALMLAGTTVVPAAAGYVTTDVVKNNIGFYGFLAFCGLAAVPAVLQYRKAPVCDKLSPKVQTALNSFAVGVAAHEVVSLVPTVKARLAALRS